NAILIVEFAKQNEDEGMNRFEAAVMACRLRLRAILMTAVSFILGVIPLMIATGAGSEMRQALGTTVFSGMLGVTVFGLFLTPVFYVVLRKLSPDQPTQKPNPNSDSDETVELTPEEPVTDETDSSSVEQTSQERFESAYAGEPPWNIDGPQPAFVEAAEFVRGDVLDAGCGTGENAIYFASRGHTVLGVDFSETAIAKAKEKAQARNVDVEFQQGNALQLEELNRTFDTVLDSGLFHVFDDENRARYVDQLGKVLKPGGIMSLLCFSDKEPPGIGPRRVTESEIHESFANGWEIQALQPTRFSVRDTEEGRLFTEGGPWAWLARIQRTDG
ncbi:MAG: efflux RND transporter permease subunit, partial [Planctomycetaceae bacterium]|nr:efflux RND transporter permease subunit [Planctomycetaceae bacterium]